MRNNFYDPWFAIATAVLSVLTWPLWVVVTGSGEAGIYATGGFVCIMLAAMLTVSWQMAHERY